MQAPEPMRGLVFDKDGTLFDFQATWGEWCADFIAELAPGDPARARALAEALGFDPAARRFLATSPAIAGTMEVVIDAILGAAPGLDEARLRQRVIESTAEAPQVETAPLRPLLGRLVDAGIRLGLATNDAEVPARAHLARAGVLDQFAFLAGYDSGHGAKPGPGMLDAFCRATGLPPSACAMIGDSEHDLASGRAAGMVAVAVLTGPASAAELAPFADAILPDIAALPDWLGLDRR